MNAAQRDVVRRELDQSRRATLKPEARPGRGKSPVVRAAETARRASEARPLMEAITVAGKPRTGRCQFCGATTKTDVCGAHADLVAS